MKDEKINGRIEKFTIETLHGNFEFKDGIFMSADSDGGKVFISTNPLALPMYIELTESTLVQLKEHEENAKEQLKKMLDSHSDEIKGLLKTLFDDEGL